MATVNVFLKEGKANKVGEAPIKFLIYSNGKKREKSLGVRVLPDQWDAEKRRVRKNHPQSSRFNQLISEKRAELLALALELEQGRKSLQNKTIRELLSGGGEMNFFMELDKMVQNYEENEQYSTGKQMAAAGNHLRRFVDHLGWSGLNLGDFSKEIPNHQGRPVLFLEAYKQFSLAAGASNGTVKAYLLKILRVFNYKIKTKQISPDLKPWVSLPAVKSRTDFLNPDQLEALRNLDLSRSPKSAMARDMYVFSALAGGLRFSDVLTLTHENLRGDVLDKITIKTGAHVVFRLGEIPFGIVKKYSGESGSGLVFPLINPEILGSEDKKALKKEINRCNSGTDGLLIRVAKKIDVSHSMSFHTARHTFATMAVRKGMKITTLQKLMGHSKISQTEKYWHVTGCDIDEEVAAFNAQFKVEAAPTLSPNPATLPPGVEMLRFYALQTAQMQAPNLSPAFAGVVVNPHDLEAYQKETTLPEPLRKRVAVRVFAYSVGPVAGEELGALEGLQKALNANSLFGAGVVFEVAPAGREMVVEWIGDGVEWAA